MRRPGGVVRPPPPAGRDHRRGRRPPDPGRRPLADRLRLLQLPRPRPGTRDHRGHRRLPGPLGHPPELVADARATRPCTRRSRSSSTELLGAADTLVLPTITQIHISVIPVLAGQGTVFVGRAGPQDDLRRLRVRPGPRRHPAAVTPTTTSSELERRCCRRRPSGPRLVCMDGVNSMTGNAPDLAAFAGSGREHDAILYVDDAHGFGVIGERDRDETSPYGMRGNAIVRYSARPTTTSCWSVASPRRTRRCWPSWPARPS